MGKCCHVKGKIKGLGDNSGACGIECGGAMKCTKYPPWFG